jgi:hypothetical protein
VLAVFLRASGRLTLALLTVANASGLDGAALTFTAATSGAGGDTLTGGQGVHLYVNNGSGASINVTIATPETVEGSLAVADRVIAVAAGQNREIPVPSRYNDATGLATVTYSAVTTVTVAAARASVTA